VNPESPYFQLVGTLHALGQEALQRKNYAEAKKHYTSILELFPRNKLANAYLISANISQKPESRAEVLEKLYQQAEQEKNKNPIEAKRLLDLIASISPTDSRIQKIREDIQKQSPVRRDPQVSDEKLNIQYENAISIAQQNPAGAIQICKSILNSNPGFAKARSLQARIESRLNESKWRQPARELNPQAERFYADGVIAYNSGRIRDARNLFQRAVQLQPDFVRAKNALQKCSAYLNS
ncbi:MAG: tetratricopeptide repeat protein, partial [Leptospiraceae bacterium]|nr:tetratricopeptide repeat protein [Leptospiraceae bacterium]